jgi:hypothetical protein
MVSVSVKIDPKSFEEFQRACEEFAKGLGVDTHDVAIAQAHLICRDAMDFTPPMLKSGGGGMSDEARMMGEGAVRADINSIAVSANKRSAAFLMYRKLGEAAFRNDRSYFDRVMNNSSSALKTVKNSIMIKIANDPDHERAFKKARNLFARAVPQTTADGLYDKIHTDLREPHEKMKRKYNGRKIREKQKSNWMNKYITDYQYVIDNEYERSKKSVGALKAGWAKAKARIPKMKGRVVKKPGGSVNKWILKHTAPTGILDYSYSQTNLRISIINTMGNNNNVATIAGTKNIVYGNRVKQMPLELENVLKAQAEKFNKKSK